MKTHLHLPLLAEALIAPNTTPEPCGQYDANSHRHLYKGQARC